MEKRLESIKEVFSNLKNKQIKFNPNPWRRTEDKTASKNIAVQDDSFVDLHMKVARKVDNLIHDMEQEKTENVKSTVKK